MVFLGAFLGMFLFSSARSGVFFVECETFSGAHNLAGDVISAAYCGGAIGGLAVVGVDVAGEWIEVGFNAPMDADYSISLRTNSPALQQSTVKGTVTGGGGSVTFTFLGLGVG